MLKIWRMCIFGAGNERETFDVKLKKKKKKKAWTIRGDSAAEDRLRHKEGQRQAMRADSVLIILVSGELENSTQHRRREDTDTEAGWTQF